MASAIPSQRIVASGSGLGEPDQDGDEWEPADCGLLLGYYGLCPRPQTQAPGQGAPLLITCLCPILEGLVDIHRVSQGLGKGKKQGPRTSWKRTRHFPWEPGSSSSGGARSKMSHRIPGGGNWGWRVGVGHQCGWGEARCRASSPSWTLAPRSPERWSL